MTGLGARPTMVELGGKVASMQCTEHAACPRSEIAPRIEGGSHGPQFPLSEVHMKLVIALFAVLVGGVAHAQARPSAASSGQVYFEFQVDRAVQPAANSASPVYSREIKKLRAEGQVTAEFVVDTLGFVDTTSLKVHGSPHELFTAAVRRALPNMRFTPAVLKGRRVKQLVRQQFTFRVPD